MAPPAGYQLVWSDEFDGTSLDTNKWNIAYGQASVSNSILKLGPNDGEIVARRSEDYTHPKYLFRYGYMEVKMRFAFDPNNPTVHRRTHRSGPWIVGGWNTNNISNPTKGTWAGEIDVTETGSGPIQNDSTYCGGNKINTSVHRFLNSSPYSGPDYTYASRIYNSGYNLSNDYHILGCEWTSDYLSVFLDGNEVNKITSSSRPIPESYMYPIIGLCPRCWPLYGPDNTYESPCSSDVPTGREIALVDYIRIYQLGQCPPVLCSYKVTQP